MAYFYGKWALDSDASVSGSYSCVINFKVGEDDYKGITISQNGVSLTSENGDPYVPVEDDGKLFLDFGEGARSSSIDKGFCGAFMECFYPYSDDANIIGMDPLISVEGYYLTLERTSYADRYTLYINGDRCYDFDFRNTINLTKLIPDGTESCEIYVVAYYEDDVFDSTGKAIPFSVTSNTVTFSLTSEPDEPDVPKEVTEYLIKTETLKDIANAIRERRGFSYQIPAVAFADEIRSIESETSSPTCIDLAATENGQYLPEEYGVDYFSEVNVNVPIPKPNIETLDVTENGVYNPPEGVDGYSTVTVNVEGGNSKATTVALDFRNYEKGSFTETLSNGLVLTHTVEFDDGTPTSVDNIEVTGV